MKSMNTMISFMQMILILAGAVSIAMAVNEVPAIWSFILPWLRPPYLLIVINGIIITIAAASRFRRSQLAPPVRSQHLTSVRAPPPAYYDQAYSSPLEVYESEDRVVELRPVMVNGWRVDADAEVVAEDEGENAMAGRDLTYNTPSPKRFSPEFQLEYFRSANPTGNIPEGEMVSRRETLDSSWKNKKERTSSVAHEEFRHGGPSRPAPDKFRYSKRKSKSFKERTIFKDSPSSDYASSDIRKKASPNRNKLNRRVDAEDVPMDRSLTDIFSPGFHVDYLSPPTEEEHETLDSAWKKITEGTPRAAAQEEVRCFAAPRPSLDRVSDYVPKSTSFRERAIYDDLTPSRASSGIRKEVSPHQDELNRRVEAFIKKVNDEIRLCRQNSLDQFIQLNSAA